MKAPIPKTLDDWKDMSAMSASQLEDYGMRRWNSNEDGSVLMLVPHDWFEQLPAGLVLECIDGEMVTVGTDHVDDDHRFGLLAYGIRVKNYVLH